MPDDRIAKLSERFRTHAVGRRPAAGRNRERHSFYLDADLVARLDRVYRDVNHGLHPASLSKSTFLETIMEYGLDHLDELKAILAQQADTSDTAEK